MKNPSKTYLQNHSNHIQFNSRVWRLREQQSQIHPCNAYYQSTIWYLQSLQNSIYLSLALQHWIFLSRETFIWITSYISECHTYKKNNWLLPLNVYSWKDNPKNDGQETCQLNIVTNCFRSTNLMHFIESNASAYEWEKHYKLVNNIYAVILNYVQNRYCILKSQTYAPHIIGSSSSNCISYWRVIWNIHDPSPTAKREE